MTRAEKCFSFRQLFIRRRSIPSKSVFQNLFNFSLSGVFQFHPHPQQSQITFVFPGQVVFFLLRLRLILAVAPLLHKKHAGRTGCHEYHYHGRRGVVYPAVRLRSFQPIVRTRLRLQFRIAKAFGRHFRGVDADEIVRVTKRGWGLKMRSLLHTSPERAKWGVFLLIQTLLLIVHSLWKMIFFWTLANVASSATWFNSASFNIIRICNFTTSLISTRSLSNVTRVCNGPRQNYYNNASLYSESVF